MRSADPRNLPCISGIALEALSSLKQHEDHSKVMGPVALERAPEYDLAMAAQAVNPHGEVGA